jgi:hypothetical protein
LGLAALACAVGCASYAHAPASNAAAVPSASREHPAKRAARDELGPEVAAEIDVETRPVRRPTEPGARAVVDAITRSLPDDDTDESEPASIGLGHLRNLSRSTPAEFEAFRQRLAGLLSEAGHQYDLEFLADEQTARYELLGTAYLVTAEGFDQWEVYFRLSPADASWTLWQPSAPLRVLRQPRPAQPQITRWPLPPPPSVDRN